jgi:hypothetical protein
MATAHDGKAVRRRIGVGPSPGAQLANTRRCLGLVRSGALPADALAPPGAAPISPDVAPRRAKRLIIWRRFFLHSAVDYNYFHCFIREIYLGVFFAFETYDIWDFLRGI